ncbi:uncharacterized protein RSE6_05135 [Rhynchosporium secalis]|uniref:Uncharacterized protein n=1 Tax=Rhynchosporium secalis TaxID=38038 RepID=A0A1E1M706_RHYSE|nr:uncharacterized protein RSE6_05135 [Rhynchosporium secalis]
METAGSSSIPDISDTSEPSSFIDEAFLPSKNAFSPLRRLAASDRSTQQSDEHQSPQSIETDANVDSRPPTPNNDHQLVADADAVQMTRDKRLPSKQNLVQASDVSPTSKPSAQPTAKLLPSSSSRYLKGDGARTLCETTQAEPTQEKISVGITGQSSEEATTLADLHVEAPDVIGEVEIFDKSKKNDAEWEFTDERERGDGASKSFHEKAYG